MVIDGQPGSKGEAGVPGRFGFDGWPGLKGERGDDGTFGEVIQIQTYSCSFEGNLNMFITLMNACFFYLLNLHFTRTAWRRW